MITLYQATSLIGPFIYLRRNSFELLLRLETPTLNGKVYQWIQNGIDFYRYYFPQIALSNFSF